MMSKKTILIILLGLFFTPSASFCQITDTAKIKMNRISLQTGLFHYFFDGAPLTNVGYLNKNVKPFNGFFIDSKGIQYTRIIDDVSSLSIEYMRFGNDYRKHALAFPISKGVIYFRSFFTFNINYNKYFPLTQKINFTYGGGINYRRGNETIVITRFQTTWGYELIVHGSQKYDYGLNAFTGIEYTPKKWLTLYTKIDFLSLIYIYDKNAIIKLRQYTQHRVPLHYPSRFDLSLRFGIGINF